MRNRFYSIVLPTTLAISVTLTACGAGTSRSEPSNSQSVAASAQTPPSQSDNSNQGNQAADKGIDQTKSTADVVSEVKSKLKMKGAMIPSSFPIDAGHHLTASIERNGAQSYEVIFYQTKKALPINDKSLQPNGNVPVIASFIARTYEDPSSATDIFPPINVEGGPEAVDLGHSIKGFSEGAAGHSYLNWREGNWILQIHSLLKDQMNNQGIARKMVAYLENHSLPAPKDKGRVKVEYRSGGKDVYVGIYWQDGNVIYELETDKVPLDALKMAVSVK